MSHVSALKNASVYLVKKRGVYVGVSVCVYFASSGSRLVVSFIVSCRVGCRLIYGIASKPAAASCFSFFKGGHKMAKSLTK